MMALLSRMMAFLSRYRRALISVFALVLVVAVLVQTVPFVHMAWDTFTGRPDLGLVRDVRHTLLDQVPFRKKLATHEEEAMRRHRAGGPSAYQRRRLVKVNLTPFGMPNFHDIFAVRVRTDIVQGTAYTSFLARPGVVFSSSDIPFFSRQCEGALCRAIVQKLVESGQTLLDWGLLTPYRLNITEMDETSSAQVGTEAISTSRWSRESWQLHQKGIGHSFTGDGSLP